MLLLALLFPAHATTRTVGEGGDHATLAEAVAAAAPGDRIEIGAGSFPVGGLTVPVDVTIAGAGPEATVLSGEGPLLVVPAGVSLGLAEVGLEPSAGRAMAATDATLELDTVRMEGGRHPERGGCLDLAGGTATLTGTAFVDCRTEGFGGAIHAAGATLDLDAVSVRTSRAERGGGLFLDGGAVMITGSTFTRNGASAGENRGIGGAIATEATTLRVVRTTFVENRVVEGHGGAISTFGGRLELEDVDMVGLAGQPEATRYFGGGLAAYDTVLTWRGGTLTDLDVAHDGSEGSFGLGGAILIYGDTGADFTLEGLKLLRSAATAFGGGVRIDTGNGVIRGCTFEDGLADYGAGLHVATGGRVVVEGSTFRRNRARFAGAVRWRPTGTEGATAELVLRDNLFEDNEADRYGGVLYGRAARALVLDGNRLFRNRAQLGGALMLWAVEAVEVRRNHFCLNRAEGGTDPDGGALASYLTGRASYTVAHNLFQENRAVARGGAVSLLRDGPVDLIHNTFLANRAAVGAALGARGTEATPQQVQLRHNLVAWSAAGDGVDGDDLEATLAWNAFHRNQAVDTGPDLPPLDGTHLFEEPALQAYDPDGECGDDVAVPRSDSPLVDAGDPAEADPDGSAPDIGWTGGAAADPAFWTDADGDGAEAWRDCDDDDATRFPGAEEVARDGIDQDCDGEDALDADGDGFDGGEDGPDCDDQDPEVNPDAAETWYDGIDQDCDGADDFDRDRDGFEGGPDGEDCDDQDPAIHPEAPDPVGDGIDQDCDGRDGGPGDAREATTRRCTCQGVTAPAGLLGALLALGLVVARRRGGRHGGRRRA